MPLQPAILGNARLANFRLGYESAALASVRATKVRILLAGADVSVRVNGLIIRDLLNEAPNECQLTIASPAPSSGAALRITINSDTPRLLFNGTIQNNDTVYEGKPTQLAHPCTAIDDTARLNKRRPFGTWVNVSATTIAQYLVANFAPGFTDTGIEAALPLVTITFDGSATFMTCLFQLATLVGGYCNVVDGVVYLFLTDVADPPDDIDSTPDRFLNDPPIRASFDDSQLRTRVYGKGHAELLLSDVLAGETILPIPDAVMFNASGGQAIASTTSDGAVSQILSYSTVDLGGAGTLVGTGATPSTAPIVTAVLGAGLSAGTYQYAYTDVTALGESLPSPIGTVSTGIVPAPGSAPTTAPGTQGFCFFNIGDTIRYSYSYSLSATPTDQTQETVPGPAVTVTAVGNPFGHMCGATPAARTFYAVVAYSTDVRVLKVKVYRSINGGSYHLVTHIANNTAGGTVALHDVSGTGGQAPLGSPTAALNQIAVSGIAVGASGTTSRKVYRTVVDGSQLKLHTTIANNTATTIANDTLADGSLGANAPVTDTSGLAQPSGQVNAGSTTLVTASPAPFNSTGGWALIGGVQAIRYTGISVNTLTGIPATGPGAILTTVAFGSQILPAPSLIDVTGLTVALAKGSPVHIWVQRDDLAAQAAAVTRESTPDYTSDGIHEHVIVDARRGEASLTALCDADLARFSMPLVTVTYATRDVKTKAGKPVVVNLASPPISETLTIQDVTITEIDIAKGLAPKFLVKASSVRFSLEDLLRRMAAN
jgi:hypothetical protein